MLRPGTQSGGDSTPHKRPRGERCPGALRVGVPFKTTVRRALPQEATGSWGLDEGGPGASLEREPTPEGPRVPLCAVRSHGASGTWTVCSRRIPEAAGKRIRIVQWARAGAGSQTRRGRCSDRAGSRGHERGQCPGRFWRNEVKKMGPKRPSALPRTTYKRPEIVSPSPGQARGWALRGLRRETRPQGAPGTVGRWRHRVPGAICNTWKTPQRRRRLSQQGQGIGAGCLQLPLYQLSVVCE